MSIYATLWQLEFPRYGDAHTGCEWIRVFAEAVPEHVEPPEFLPCDRGQIEGGHYHAVVIVTRATKKGPPHAGPQQHVEPLLVLSAAEYAVTDFSRLHARICDALRGDRPRFVGESMRADGRTTLVYEDGTSRVIETPVEVSSS